ncbi:ATP-binding protein, partial [Intestinibacter sp.]|uniref:ATP-binding protein n=1 Tax=Intestinibacter sp. TaxID=1965304 RepID=UPI003F153FEA
IMERFKRADESRNTEGSGLGLAIARDLVKLQGGNMTIDIDGDLFKVTVEMDEYTPISLSKDK